MSPLQIRSQAYPGANFMLRRHGLRSAKANSITVFNSHRVAGYASRTGPPPMVRQWDRRTPQGRQGTDAWCARGEDGRMHVVAAIAFGRKSRLKKLMACMSGLSGSTTSPLTIDGTKICESGYDLPLCSGDSFWAKLLWMPHFVVSDVVAVI